MVLADGAGTPLGIHVEAATPAEVKLVEQTLANGRIGGRRAKRRKPKRLIADRGYDSNPLRALLVKRDGVDAVSRALEGVAAALSPPLHLRLVGPLPPYSFVTVDLPVGV